MRQEEHNIQVACVRWFNLQYPQYRGLLFAVPNGSYRNKATAGRLKAEGVVAGVADLILLVPQFFLCYTDDKEAGLSSLGGYDLCCGLCIEMKTTKGRQSPKQKEWQAKVEDRGYRYRVCHSIEEFMNEINDYLK